MAETIVIAAAEQLNSSLVPSTSDHSGARSDGDLVGLWLATKVSGHTRRAYEADADAFVAWLAECGMTLRTLTAVAMQAWASNLTGAVRTRARRVSAIKSLLSFAHRLGYTAFNVGGVLTVPKVPNDLAERIVGVDEVRALIGAIPAGRDRVLASFLYLSGARVSEACGIEWRHVHMLPDGRAVVALFGKGGKTRHVLLPANISAELEQLRQGAADTSPVFATSTGRKLHETHVRTVLAAAAERVGLRRVSPHWLRHAHASHALDAGCPVHIVQATLGHASLTTTSRYVHARPSDSAGMYLKL